MDNGIPFLKYLVRGPQIELRSSYRILTSHPGLRTVTGTQKELENTCGLTV